MVIFYGVNGRDHELYSVPSYAVYSLRPPLLAVVSSCFRGDCEPVVLSVLNLVLHSSILSLQSSDVDLERRWLGYHEMNDAYCMPELGWNAVG